MEKINLAINGMPGNMAKKIAEFAHSDPRFQLVPVSLTGPEISDPLCRVAGIEVKLIRPEARADFLSAVGLQTGRVICIDYTHPAAVNDNAVFYCRNRLPFVMGTTGGNRAELEKAVGASETAAVIAPNMAKQIVGFQAMMAHAAETFPDLFKGYKLDITESHQSAKADTSGTAKAMVSYFDRLGIPFTENDIRKIRDPKVQKDILGVPDADITGHAWHTYTLVSPDKTVTFRFTHNVNGRDIYVQGTLDAVAFLDGKLEEGAKGKVYSMIDVLKGA